MNVRNANIGVAVGCFLLLLGCWLAGWDVDDGEGSVIMVVVFVGAIGVTLALGERDYRAGRRHHR
jgi:hypothetical protein